MLIRLRQFDAEAHCAPVTTGSDPGIAVYPEPGSLRPVLRQPASASPQLIPMIGITTIEQATSCEQPSDWFSATVRTSKSVAPVPSLRVGSTRSFGGIAPVRLI